MLANKANIPRPYLADIENDRYSPSLDVLKSIANAYQLLEDRPLEARKLKFGLKTT
ncbi:helix-turn-helix domain-containing protein [Thermaerobacillus caldiproteolyticus]|nr:helix-turn-helix transcriptional regulator [Anoxybacillus caldiproteolyticus]